MNDKLKRRRDRVSGSGSSPSICLICYRKKVISYIMSVEKLIISCRKQLFFEEYNDQLHKILINGGHNYYWINVLSQATHYCLPQLINCLSQTTHYCFNQLIILVVTHFLKERMNFNCLLQLINCLSQLINYLPQLINCLSKTINYYFNQLIILFAANYFLK